MNRSHLWQDRLLLTVLLTILIGMPLWIVGYEKTKWGQAVSKGTRIIEITGHEKKGWIVGRFAAHETATGGVTNDEPAHPVIRVKKGEKIALKITSSDVIHGFTLKDYGIYIKDGVLPGKVVLVEFIADMEGRFQFICNAFCGQHHERMIGTLVVEA